MKKLLLFTAVALFALTSVQSQEFRLGAKAGLNVATLGGDSYYGGSSREDNSSANGYNLVMSLSV